MYLISAITIILISLFRWKFLNNSKHGSYKPYVIKTREKQCFEFYLHSFAPLYRICFAIFSLLAFGTSGYFYCCCILYVFLKSSPLEQLLIALKRSGMFISTKFSITFHKYMSSYSIDLCDITWTGCFIYICSFLICFSTQIL